ERRAPRRVVAMLHDEAVDPGTQLRDQLLMRVERDPRRRGEERHLELGALELVLAQRREARILERRGARVGRDVLGERPVRLERSDAAAQLAVELERD